jgi:cellulose synthase/poly-beta-1,6-N-acetylglucosamine synthase-like glycosyltransferase
VRGAVTAGLLGAVAGYGHVLYPAWLAVRTRNLPDAAPPDPQAWPALTVVVPAYRESGIIRRKVGDVEANGYPGRLEVLVVADDPATAAAARSTGATVIAGGARLGKAEALNRGVQHAAHPIVVMTDANTDLTEGALCALVRWFADPQVHAVAGEKIVRGDAGEAAYWRFESWLKRRESAAGTTIGLVGELGAVRRERYSPLPPDAIVDDMWLALDIAGRGGRIVYEPAARAVEDPSPSMRDEWERRTRVAAGIVDTCWRRRDLLAPSHGLVAAELWGHRLARSAFGPLAHLALLVLALRGLRRSRLAGPFVAGHLWAAAALVRGRRGARLGRLQRIGAQVLWLQVVALGGLVRYLRQDHPALWPKPERGATR